MIQVYLNIALIAIIEQSMLKLKQKITRKKKNQHSDKSTQPKVNWINLRDPDKADMFMDTVAKTFNTEKNYQNLATSVTTYAKNTLINTHPQHPPGSKYLNILKYLITKRNFTQSA